MFSKGEMVVYGHTGVCTVEDLCEKEIGRTVKLYYMLKPLYQNNNVIYAPVDSDRVFMRKIITTDEARLLIEHMPEMEEEVFTAVDDNTSPDCRSCEMLAKAAMKIYKKKQELRKTKGKLCFSDERNLKNTEDMLFGELAVVWSVTPSQVPDILFSRIKQKS